MSAKTRPKTHAKTLPKTLTVLGSTGSVGRNVLDIVARFPERYRVHALAARASVEALAAQIERFRPRVAVLYEPEAAQRLRDLRVGGGQTRVLSGMEGLLEAAAAPEVRHVVAGMVGAIGLQPAYAAVEAGKELSIANKETMVLAGELMMARAEETGAVLLPMDSEHNAVFQCLGGGGTAALDAVERIVLTASGGPFRDLPLERFHAITKAEALTHPNWSMGPKITIDSATLLNKGLEVIEARWLFRLPPERIGVTLHRQSIVHALVEFVDGSVIAQLGLPDMRTPIACCLAWPERLPLALPRLNLAQVGRLDFAELSAERYPCFFLALDALRLGGGAPAALNGANEVVVQAYLDDAFSFPRIAGILKEAMAQFSVRYAAPDAPPFLRRIATVDDAIRADRFGRELANGLIAQREGSPC
jgi:1-deoxy-D-xylulose-5-phosphate reductoisomerase